MSVSLPASVSEFAQLAGEFCAWCEADSLGTDADRSAATWLALLYAAALKLPHLEPETDELKPVLPAEERERAARNFAAFWGRNYRQVFDPRPEEDEPAVLCDLGDDLSGVYDDIKGSLVLYRRGSVLDAVWNWRFDLETHWGHHAVGALSGLHHLTISGLG